MRTAGFPCRSLGCDQVFQVLDQKSMVSLQTASAARTAHELGIHDYHHVELRSEPSRLPFQAVRPRPPVKERT